MIESVVTFLIAMAFPCLAIIIFDSFREDRSDTREIIAYTLFGMWAVGIIGRIILKVV